MMKPEPSAARFALAITTRRARLLRHVALEELAEHRRQAFEVGHLPGGDAPVRQFLLGTDVDHRRRASLDRVVKSGRASCAAVSTWPSISTTANIDR
jgi:hypothetical protein